MTITEALLSAAIAILVALDLACWTWAYAMVRGCFGNRKDGD